MPSLVHTGEPTARSSDAVSTRASPLSTGTTASLFWPYAENFGSLPCRYAIHLPSGLQTGRPPSGPSNFVSCFGCAVTRASTT